jgi:hypothetical protein
MSKVTFLSTLKASLWLRLWLRVDVEFELSSLDVPSIQYHFYPSSSRCSLVAHFEDIGLL